MTAVAHPRREAAISLLADLVGFPSVSLRPNGPIVTHIESYLKAQRVTCWRDRHPDGERFKLLARVGPGTVGGALLSGHLDVVPAGDGGWGADPFTLHRRDGKLFGRGAGDMKGFLAMALAMVPVSTILGAIGFLGERPDAHVLIGGLIVIGGVGAVIVEPSEIRKLWKPRDG